MKKRLLVTASTFPTFTKDGEPRFVYDLAKSLLDRFDVTVLAPASPGALLEEDMDGVRVVRYRYAPVRSLETLTYPGAIVPRIREKPARIFLVPLLLWGLRKAVLQELKREKYDCIHAHWLIPQGMVQSWLPRKSPPFVVTGHGSDVFSLNSRLFLAIKRRVLDQAAAVTVVSEALRKRVLPMNKKNDVHVMPMGCDICRFSPTFRELDYYRHIGIKGTIVLFVGRLTENKGVSFLIEALCQQPLLNTDAHIVIVGDGPMKISLEKQVVDRGIKHRVTFLGKKSHNELSKIYASSDIFCAPSIVFEGLPSVILEAAASGLPVVSTNVGGISEIVKNKKNGLLVEQRNSVELANAIYWMIENVSFRIQMGVNGIQEAEKHSWVNVAKNYGDLFDSVIEKSAKI